MKINKYLSLIFLTLAIPWTLKGQVVSDVYSHAREGRAAEVMNVPLETLLEEYEDRFGVHILFKSEEVEGRVVQLKHPQPESVDEGLSQVLPGLSMNFRKITESSYVVFSESEEVDEPVSLLQETVTGRVTDSNSKEALPGVNITLKGTSSGSTTDSQGLFEISVPSLNDTLIFSYIGYEPQQVAIDGRTEIILELSPQVYMSEELVVVGYGEQRRGTLTGSVTTMSFSERADGQPLTNASQALYGVSGLNVRLDNSYPGTARTRINMRGVGTLSGDREPLVLVDGIPYSMDELNPNDIESITVLKDASAAIYGSRAANGVIMVTTKSGERGARFTYNNYIGIQQPTTLPDVIWDSMEFLELKRQAIENTTGNVPASFDADVEAYRQGMISDPLGYPSGNNWFDIALRDGFIQKHDLSVSGGDDNYRYRLSVGYLDQEGIIFGPNNSAEEYYIGLNTTAQISDRLEVGLRLNGTYRWYTRPPYNSGGNTSYMNYLSRTLPIMPDLLENGAYGEPSIRIDGRNNWEHPRMLAHEGYYEKQVQRFVTSLSARYILPFDISYNANIGIDKYDGRLDWFIPRMQKQIAGTETITYFNSETAAPRGQNEDDNDLNLNFHQTLNWRGQVSRNHDISVMVGTSYENREQLRFHAQARGYFDGTLPALNAGTVAHALGGRTTRDVLQSYFGRFNYSFDEKYLLEAVFRYDGSSRFAKGNRWGFFPSVSAGWRVDLEPFFPDQSSIDLLKLRVSAGETGNQAVALYSYESLMNTGQKYTFGGQLAPGAAVTSHSDPNISWETTRTYNAGMDMNMMQNRIHFTLDLYSRQTRDILRSVPLPTQVGNFSGAAQNVGEVHNRGVEITAGFNNSRGNFTYQIAGNFSYNRNEVINIGGDILYNHGTNLPTITKEGHAMNSMFVYKSDGIFRNQAEVDAHVNADGEPLQPNARPGWIRYVDIDGDGEIGPDDRIIIDNSSIMPKYTFGFDLNFGYKNWALDANFQGIAGIRYYQTGNMAFPFNNGANATREWLTDAWTPENPDARLPMVMEANRAEVSENFGGRPSDFWLKDGSYLRLRNIQLSYSLPQDLLSRVGISQLTIFVNAQNWFTLTRDDHHIDVETATDKISTHHYPMLKTATTGVNITF